MTRSFAYQSGKSIQGSSSTFMLRSLLNDLNVAGAKCYQPQFTAAGFSQRSLWHDSNCSVFSIANTELSGVLPPQ